MLLTACSIGMLNPFYFVLAQLGRLALSGVCKFLPGICKYLLRAFIMMATLD